MADQYVLGTAVYFEGTFTSKDTGGLADPTEVTVDVWQSGDAAADVQTMTYNGGAGEVERISEGVYRVKTTPTKAGRIYADFQGTGNVEVAQTEYAIIADSGKPS